MNPQFDERDSVILAERVASYDSRQGPRVGDWVEMPDGTVRRFTHDHGDCLQTTYLWNDGKLEKGSFHFQRSGHMGYSGALDKAIPREQLTDTGERRPAPVWFFHHDHMRAHNGVNADVMCRVFKVSLSK